MSGRLPFSRRLLCLHQSFLSGSFREECPVSFEIQDLPGVKGWGKYPDQVRRPQTFGLVLIGKYSTAAIPLYAASLCMSVTFM
jgi:hypothetical protein